MSNLLTPMTLDDFARERRSALRKLALGAVLATATYAAADLMPSWVNGWKFVTLLVVLGTGFCWTIDWSNAFRLGKPLDGSACIRMRDLAADCPEIAELVARVRDMGRPVAWADLWAANSWLYQQKKDAEERACRELNGIVAS